MSGEGRVIIFMSDTLYNSFVLNFIKIFWHNHFLFCFVFWFFFCLFVLFLIEKLPWEITPSREIVFIAHHLPYSHKGEAQCTTFSNCNHLTLRK